MFKNYKIFLLVLFVIFPLRGIIKLADKIESLYIMGTNFKNICDHSAYPPHKYRETPNPFHYFDPKAVKDGDLIYISNDYIVDFFLNKHPKIKSRYILVSHQSDWSAPGCVEGGAYKNLAIKKRSLAFLNDPRLIAWFGLNQDLEHPKFIPLPAGICYWREKIYIDTFLEALRSKEHSFSLKNILLYINFTVRHAPQKRKAVFDKFRLKDFCTVRQSLPLSNYFDDLISSKFVLSPEGAGADCYRTWETLSLGSFPVVKTSLLDNLYEGLPILIVSDWSEVTKDFLEKKYNEMLTKEYSYEKLFMPYWIDKIMSYNPYRKRLDISNLFL